MIPHSGAYAPSSSKTSDEITKIQTRSDLSLLFRVVRTCIRPLRPHLVRPPKKALPAGSPKLPKRPRSHKGFDIVERKVDVVSAPATSDPEEPEPLWLYDYVPQSSGATSSTGEKPRDAAAGGRRHHIYYFSGGAFKMPPTGEHWKLCARIARDLAPHGVSFTLVSYPLGPNSPARDSLPMMRRWLRRELLEGDAQMGVSLMGDSAGGNLALSLSFWWAEELRRLKQQVADGKDGEQGGAPLEFREEELQALRRLKSIFVSSPPCDLSNRNPAIADAAKQDPILTKATTDMAADAWTVSWPDDNPKLNPQLSPLLQPAEAWSALRESNLRVDGLYGTADVLAPDVELFVQKCRKEGIRGSWLRWEGQIHCFMLMSVYGMREGREGVNWVVQMFKEIL